MVRLITWAYVIRSFYLGIGPFLIPMNGTGDWVIGYNRFIGNCLIFHAELWGILDGLKLIQRRGHSNVVIHSDSLKVKVSGF
ncbi:hypothetical protein Gogos_004423 [Gossypium gossypioides]|uniref:RNase H type-1 domain-containing protein n=1 Tax=Gossypium gossypioides TaxID=34282 RepID=A0A7J9CG77_GOSGO|nr:hypothetical protein [Gossypium gossypioides]